MKLPFFFTALVLTLPALHGCMHACTEIGCYTGVDVSLSQLATKSGLPLSIEICPEGFACALFSVKDGASGPECTGADAMTSGDCFVDPDGTVSAFCFIQGINEETQVKVRVTVRRDGAPVLLDSTQTVSLAEQYPNGESCGAACVNGHITL